MSENGLRKLFRIHKIKSLMSVTELHNKVSCDVVERRPNLVISTSHGLLNLQATMPSAISRFAMLMLCQFPSLSVHDSAVRTKYLYLKFIYKKTLTVWN
jgi:hypothetical protein